MFELALLIAGALLGMLLAVYSPRSVAEFKKLFGFFFLTRKRRLQFRYFKLLDNLLRENDDAAIEAFIRGVTPSSETLETHLSLAALHRRKGELQRALRIHENLLRQSELLSIDQHQRVSFELAEDYMASGLLDRAEALYREIADAGKVDESLRRSACERLIDLYQLTRDWLAAIDCADRLTAKKFDHTADSWKKKQAQFSCEIAEAAMAVQAFDEASSWLKKALRYDNLCDRAHIALAKIATQSQDWVEFNRHQSDMIARNSPFYAEFFSTFEFFICKYLSAAEIENLLCSQFSQSGSLLLLQKYAEYAFANSGAVNATQLILDKLEAYQAYKTYAKLMRPLLLAEPSSSHHSSEPESRYTIIMGILAHLAGQYEDYLCGECGFSNAHLQWKCPSCKQWGTIYPHSPEYSNSPKERIAE